MPILFSKSIRMKSSILIIVVLYAVSFNNCSQTNGKKAGGTGNNAAPVGGDCEGCEAIYESPVSFDKL